MFASTRRSIHAAAARAAVARALCVSVALGIGSTITVRSQEDVTPQLIVTVEGIACPFCVYGLEKHLRKLPGVTNVETDLRKGETTVDLAAGSEVTEEQVRKAVRDAGFTASTIERKAADDS